MHWNQQACLALEQMHESCVDLQEKFVAAVRMGRLHENEGAEGRALIYKTVYEVRNRCEFAITALGARTAQLIKDGKLELQGATVAAGSRED